MLYWREAGKRAVTDGLWVSVGQIGSALGTLVGIRLLTEFVEPSVFGAVSLLVGITTLALGLSCTPIMQATLRYFPDLASSGDTVYLRRVVTTSLSWSVGLVVVLLLVGGTIYALITDASPIIPALLSAIVVVDAIRSFETNMLNAARRHRPHALWVAGEAWARPLLAVALVFTLGMTIESVLGGYLIASLLLIMLVFARVAREGTNNQVLNSIPASLDLPATIRQYALPLVPLALLGWLSGMADRYLIGGLLGLQDAGIYAAVYGLVSRPFLMLGHILELTLRPVYQKAVAKADGDRSRRIIVIWVLSLAALSGLGVLIVVFWHDQIGILLLGERFRSGTSLMPWIAAGYALLVISFVYQRVCYAHEETGRVLFIQLIGSVTGLIVMFFGISNWGQIGAAMAIPIYSGVQLVIAMHAASQIHRRVRLAGNEAASKTRTDQIT